MFHDMSIKTCHKIKKKPLHKHISPGANLWTRLLLPGHDEVTYDKAAFLQNTKPKKITIPSFLRSYKKMSNTVIYKTTKTKT
jgi:hypothetical protein